MNLLVETTGNFLLVQTTTGQEVYHFRPTVVVSDTWTNNQLGLHHLRVLSNEVPEGMTDKDFARYWAECGGDQEMAVASFLSKADAPVEEEVKSTPFKQAPSSKR